MAKAVGPEGRVLAFEPDELNCGLLRTNLASQGVETRVTVLPIALFEREGEIVFEHSENNFGDHRVRRSKRPDGADLYGEATRTTSHVRGRPLDAVLGELGFENHPIKLMKIDTQGADRPIEALRADMAQPHDNSPNTAVEYSDYLFAK